MHMIVNHHQYPTYFEITAPQQFIILPCGEKNDLLAFVLAFYGFLRASEFTTPNLSWSNIQLNVD